MKGSRQQRQPSQPDLLDGATDQEDLRSHLWQRGGLPRSIGRISGEIEHENPIGAAAPVPTSRYRSKSDMAAAAVSPPPAEDDTQRRGRGKGGTGLVEGVFRMGCLARQDAKHPSNTQIEPRDACQCTVAQKPLFTHSTRPKCILRIYSEQTIPRSGLSPCPEEEPVSPRSSDLTRRDPLQQPYQTLASRQPR